MRFLALAALLLLACSREPNFTEIATAASLRWEKAICLRSPPDSIAYVPLLPSCNGEVRIPGWYGCYTRSEHMVEVSWRVPKSLLLQVLTHELGHSLAKASTGGAVHVPDHKGIMAAYTSDAVDHITATDIALICKEQFCPCQNPEKTSP